MKCNTCGDEIRANCDWNQGRCPHMPSMIEQIMSDPYKARYYNLVQSIKNFFTKSDCNCGNKH